MFFGGKGGVGKTTCAAAHSVAAAAAGERVLAVSTDPAHSLGDALATRLAGRPRRVPLPGVRRAGGGALFAVELDAPRAFSRWLGEHRRALGDILEHGTWLDRSDINALTGLSVPGIDELVGLLEIATLAGGGEYDRVVLDTAPTGHTLRLVSAPQAVGAVAEVLDALQEPHRLIRARLAGLTRAEDADRLIQLIARQAEETTSLLRDARRTSFHWVTLPEAMAVAESEDALAALSAAGVAVPSLIVNRVLPAGTACPRCGPRRRNERRMIAAVRRRLARGRSLTFVPAAASEPRGVAALAALERTRTATAPAPVPEAPARGRPALRPEIRATRLMLDQVTTGARLVFVGGKGGVGKTTVAAAAALAAARAEPSRPVMLISTDPAHSLGDVLESGVGDRPQRIAGGPQNLLVREIDAARAFAARRRSLEAAVREIADALGSSGLATLGGQGGRELLELAPPGVDELFGLVEIVRGAASGETLLVVDTAPTGHALRLLEMPAIAREWTQVLLRVLLKYREIVRPGALGAELVELSQSIRALQELLRSGAETRFLVVTRGAELPRLETVRLLRRLRQLRLRVPAVIVNALTLSPGACTWCRAVAAAERAAVARLTAACRRCAIIAAPVHTPPPRGIRRLERWGRTWIA